METNEKKLEAMSQTPSIVEAKPEGQKTESESDPNTWQVLYAYTRAQAIEDGFLADVTEMAKEAGFRYPLALTSAVYSHYVEVPEGVTGQDIDGRLWDILFMCGHRARGSKGESTFLFELYVRNSNRKTERVTLKAVCSGDDDGSPCITVMMPNED